MRYCLCWIVVLIALAISGCSTWKPSEPKENSLLKPVEMADDGVKIEIISMRFPFGAAEINGAMWNEIDEQQLSPEARSRLAENGIRAGVVGRQFPPARAQMIAAAEKRPASFSEAAAQFEDTSPVSRQQMQLYSGWHGEIISSGVYPELPLLLPEDGRLCGRTFSSAQGILQTKAQSLSDHRVRLQMIPQLEYGQVRQRWLAEDGRLMPQQGKPKRTFDQLAFDLTLSAEQMLVLTCTSDRGGTLGHYLFTEPRDDQLQQKLLVVRLAQSRFNDLFGSTETAGGHSADPSEKPDMSAASMTGGGN